MVKAYRFLAEAQAEFEEQIRYFDEQTAGLGDRFIQDLESAVPVIQQHPSSGAPVSKNVRKSVLRVFPFNVYYVDAPNEVVIVAVAAHRRRTVTGAGEPRTRRPDRPSNSAAAQPTSTAPR